MRVALYWAPAADDPLRHAGNAWLGRDPETGERLPQPDLPGIVGLTEAPRRYGFHATLKPPMRLAGSWQAFREEAAMLAARTAAFSMPPLAVADLSGFLALRETAPCPALYALADACVAALDAHRAPLDPAEAARRRAAGLSAAEESNLLRWGYPYVFDTFCFHMTLTRRLRADERAWLAPAARAHFAAVLAADRRVAELCLFTEAAPGAPFRLAERLPLAG